MKHLKVKKYNQMKNSTHELQNTVGGTGERTVRKVKSLVIRVSKTICKNKSHKFSRIWQTVGQDLMF